MNKTVTHPVYGTIRVEENIWTGKKMVAINGLFLRKRGKNLFFIGEGENSIPVTLKGSAMTGASVIISGEEIVVVPKPSVLDWILSMLPFLLMLVWGNSPALCAIVPLVGGGIGGAVGGVAIVLCMISIREKPLWKKLLISLLVLAATFAVGVVLGLALVSAMLA